MLTVIILLALSISVCGSTGLTKMLTVVVLLVLSISDCGSTACGPLPFIENGNVEIKPGNLTEATLTCNQGYYPSNSSITCLDTGVWENATCIRFNTTASQTSSGPRNLILGAATLSVIILVFGALFCYVNWRKRNRQDVMIRRQANAVSQITNWLEINRRREQTENEYDYVMNRRQDSTVSQIIYWREDQAEIGTDEYDWVSAWRGCLSMEHEASKMEKANTLLKMEILPDQFQLEQACMVFGRCSETFLAICKATEEYIRANSSEIIGAWTAYNCTDFKTSGNIKIVFVVFTKTGNVGIRVGDYDIYERGESDYSKESEEVLIEVENAQKNEDVFNESDLVALEKCVSENADALLNVHKNLAIISPSVKKSKRYDKENARIYDQLCIALYVHIKGLIPIAENPFPPNIGTFPTDVLEGGFSPFHRGPYAYHEQLKMGLAIHANIKNGHGNLLVGTLGGFLDHPSYGICGLTCAHVVLSGDEMMRLKNEGCINFSQSNKEVFQPVDQEAKAFGRVLSARYCEGGNGSSGMEVALFVILDRLPINGSFPDAENYKDAGFDDNNPMVYNTGKVSEVSKIRRRSEVYKYGISSEVTRGSLGFRGSVIRTKKMSGLYQSFEYRLHNQIEVLRIDGNYFALPGDSGALVFFDDNYDDSVAIGIVEGGQNNGKVFVTPICDILHTINELHTTDGQITMKKFNNAMDWD